MATIKDVAALANVSISTVSRALSGNVPVDENTRQRVLDAVEKLDYRPNILAKGLKNGRTNMIALIIPNINNLIYPAVTKGVETEARKRGYNVILCNTDEDETVEKGYIRDLTKQWIDGVILASAAENEQQIIELKKKNIPVILLFRGIDYPIDQVLVENKKGAYEMVRYLLQRGNKKIAIINGRRNLALYRERYQGYVEAMEEAEISPDRNLVVDLDFENDREAYRATYRLLEEGNRPDAIFASSDPIAWGVMHAILEFGLRIPEDISVAGFDNLETSSLMRPALTTVSQPLYKMGVVAASRLIDNIERQKSGDLKTKIYRMNTKIVVRDSTK